MIAVNKARTNDAIRLFFRAFPLHFVEDENFHMQAFKYTIIIFLYLDGFDEDNAASVLAKMEA